MKTVHDILVVLHGILKYTAAHFPGIFPAVEINYPKEIRKEMHVLSRDEQKRLAVYLLDGTDFCKFGVLLMLFTGLRIGELCALRWSDVNIKEKVISVSANMQRLRSTDTDTAEKTQILIGAPKSDTSVRTIPLTDNAVELCRKFAVRNPCAYILAGTSEFMEPRSFQYRIEKYTRECGLDGIHAHTLRHTFATRAVEVGFEIKTLSEILGHANTTITLYRIFFHKPKHAEKRNRSDSIMSVLAMSVIGIAVCAVCLCGASWAWFTASTSTGTTAIKSSSYKLLYRVGDDTAAAELAEVKVVTVPESGNCKITLKAGGTAGATGYCSVQVGNEIYYTGQIFADSTEFTFTVNAAAGTNITLTPKWGTYSGSAAIQEGGEITAIGSQQSLPQEPDNSVTAEPSSEPVAQTAPSGSQAESEPAAADSAPSESTLTSFPQS